MRQDSYWGGGPEIVALSNVLQRPIHVYELATATSTKKESKKGIFERPPKQFVLRRMACFGSPKFDRNSPLHILSADSRFPDVAPGKHMVPGNHFLAIFPQERKSSKKRPKPLPSTSSVRGGCDELHHHEIDVSDDIQPRNPKRARRSHGCVEDGNGPTRSGPIRWVSRLFLNYCGRSPRSCG